MKRIAAITLIVCSIFGGVGVAQAASNPSASCVGFGSSALGPLGMRDDLARNPETTPPGADTSSHARTHGGSFDVCFGGG